MHDALYQVDDDRFIDLMMVRLDAPDLRAAVRTLLAYIATDVGARSAIALAVEAPSAAAADSAAVLMRATLGNAAECGSIPAADQPASLRLLYGPSARLRCLSAHAVPGGVLARLEVQR
jgi:hypothetical protein